MYSKLYLSFIFAATASAFQFDRGVRLVDGPYRSEGVLELYFFGQWGRVCGGIFSIETADSLCTSLGYTRSRRFFTVRKYANLYIIINAQLLI